MSNRKSAEVYLPREDSFLLQSCIPENLKGKAVLDMGTGTGILAITAAKAGAKVSAVDCDSRILNLAKENAAKNSVKIKFTESDTFSNVRGRYDFILCNPPYLPEDFYDRIAGPSKVYSGGPSGRSFIEKFAKDAGKFLKPGGKVLMVISDLTGEKEVKRLFVTKGFRTKAIARQKIPWEELIVIEATKLTS